jgi:2-amino-4-hydroxy-6-hydroxymethyldihydropteridine diphosphokinase
MASEVYLSLGSNLCDRKAHLSQALEKLRVREIVPTRISSFYETEPVDVTDQPDFLNLACQVTTAFDPSQLLSACQWIELDTGRVRERDKGPRTLDIDIVLYDQQIVNEPQLSIPHPHWSQRNFVLIPLMEIAPDLRDPVTGQTLEELLARSPDLARVRAVTRSEGI